MRINTNISAMNTYSRLTQANTNKSESLVKFSSGLRINKAGDEACTNKSNTILLQLLQ